MDVACINRDSVDDEAPVMLQFLMKLTWISIRVFYEDTKFTILALLLPPANEVGMVMFSQACVKNSVHN